MTADTSQIDGQTGQKMIVLLSKFEENLTLITGRYNDFLSPNLTRKWGQGSNRWGFLMKPHCYQQELQ